MLSRGRTSGSAAAHEGGPRTTLSKFVSGSMLRSWIHDGSHGSSAAQLACGRQKSGEWPCESIRLAGGSAPTAYPLTTASSAPPRTRICSTRAPAPAPTASPSRRTCAALPMARVSNFWTTHPLHHFSRTRGPCVYHTIVPHPKKGKTGGTFDVQRRGCAFTGGYRGHVDSLRVIYCVCACCEQDARTLRCVCQQLVQRHTTAYIVTAARLTSHGHNLHLSAQC
jgi:hypothetical protein